MYRFRNYLKSSLLLSLLLLWAAQASTQIRINELLALNASVAYDPDFGEFSDFIELYNPGNEAINLKDYSITDNPNNPVKWVFPDILIAANGYLVLWADGRNKFPGDTAWCSYRESVVTVGSCHTNFALSGDGEYIALFDRQKNLIDEQWFGVQENDISYGRAADDPGKWLFLGEVSPGTANPDYGATALHFSTKPEFSLPAGIYANAQTLSLQGAPANAQIRYTFDGSTPDRLSPLYEEPIGILRNLTIKARIYEPGKLPSPVVTQSYLIGENSDLPVVSISANSEHLHGNEFGLIRNAIKDREIPATIEYFEPNGTRGFVTGMGLRVFGSTIYNLPQKPLSIRFRARYGEPELIYPLFEDRENDRFQSIQLRNGGNDHNLAFFRDGLAVNLAKNKMDIDYQEYKPCVVFINGEYQGIYEIRERLDAKHIANNHHISETNIDLLEDSVAVNAGDAHDYRRLLDYVAQHDLSQEENFAWIESKIDLNEYTNYLIHKIFIGYWLFDLNNKYWREREENGKWRWIANDMEHAFGQISGDDFWENTLEKVAGASADLPNWSVQLFKSLLNNPGFRDIFIQRFAAYLNTIYQPANTLAEVDRLEALLSPHMPRHIGKWGTPATLPVWQGNVEFIRQFLRQRPSFVRQHLAGLFGVADSAKVDLHIVGQGRVSISGAWVAGQQHTGYYFKETMLELTAIPEPGYRFAGWMEINTPDENLHFKVNGHISLTALFEQESISIIPALIERDTVLSASLSPWHALTDIRVKPGATLTIEAGNEIRMTDKASVYVQGGLKIMGTASEPVTIQPDAAAFARKPFYNKRPRWGVFCATDATDTIRIAHARFSSSSYGQNRRKHFAAITSLNSHIVIENTHIADNIQPFYSEGGSVYIGHSQFRSQNTCDLINVKYSNQALVEWCDLMGNSAPDTDAVDYDGVIGGIIRHNRIYGFWGSNSDGIDLGEGARDVLVENNIIYNCADKGISVGQGSTIHMRRNLIFNCDMGVAVKDSFSHALVDQNTFYMNNYAVTSYEKNTSRGGGNAVVRNSIMAASLTAAVMADQRSSVLVSYSLSDTDTLPGTGNLYADPLFVHAATGNFELKPASPAINSGDPFSESDPDQTRADMGAYYTHTGPWGLTVHINEINYHSANNYDTGDWIEIHNAGNQTVDMTNWMIKDQLNSFEIRQTILLQPGDYLVLCQDSALFDLLHPTVKNRIGNLGFELNNKSGFITLINNHKQPVHAVKYADTWPWPPLADGKGATIELEHNTEGNHPDDWRESYLLMGTPGKANSAPPHFNGLFINELMASNKNTLADEFGEYDDWFELYNENSSGLNLGGLYFTDNLTNPRKWQMPLNHPGQSTIGAKGYLLLWADDQTDQGPMHTSFKLSADGEELGIFQRINKQFVPIDQVIFGRQTNSQSHGRYPDGADKLVFMHPSPRHPNWNTLSEESPLPALSVYPNPMEHYTIFSVANTNKPYNIEVINQHGITIWRSSNKQQNQVRMERGTLLPGIYLYRISHNKQLIKSGKLVVK